MGGYTPFNSGFGDINFGGELESEEEKRRRKLEEAERSSISQAMDTEPKWSDPETDPLNAVEEGTNPGSVDTKEEPDYLDDYAKHLGERPERGDYEPSTLRKILSVIGGTLSGTPGTSEKLAYGKFNRAEDDWRRKGAGLQEVAELGGKRYTTDTVRRGQNITSQANAEDYELGGRGATTSEGNLTVREGELEEKKRAAGVSEADVGVGRGLEGRRAATGEANAASTAARAASYGENVESLDEFRKARIEAGFGSNSDPNMSPSQQGNLDSLALSEVIANNPQWEKFARINQKTDEVQGIEGMQSGEDQGFMWFDKDDTDSSEDPDYAEFMVAYEEARKRRAQTAGLDDIPPYSTNMGDQ